MKAMVLTALHELELQERPEPKLKNDTDVLLKLEAIGVCGSDIHYYRTGRIGDQVVKYPFMVGHECAATVVKTGKAVRNLKAGDRVTVDPAVSCYQCNQCLKGRFHTCRKLKFLGCPGQLEGCLAEYLVMPARSLYRIPAKMSIESAALCEPLAIGYYAVKLANLHKGANIGILGLGPIGLSILIAARAHGAGHIYVSDPLAYRVKAALKNGAAFGCDPYQTNLAKAVAEREPGLLDVVFECCGKQEALNDGCQLLTNGGKLMIVGIPTVDSMTYDPHLVRRKELAFQNVRRQNECVEATIDMVEHSGIDVNFMITHRFPFAQTTAAFDLVDKYADGVIKAMITF